jgi:tetrahydrodipicolinate N-succinyltransferase
MNLSPETLPSIIEELSSPRDKEDRGFEENVFNLFISLLDSGSIRAAEKINGSWEVHAWVKKGILLGFKLGALRKVPSSSPFSFFDKHTYPTKEFSVENNVSARAHKSEKGFTSALQRRSGGCSNPSMRCR